MPDGSASQYGRAMSARWCARARPTDWYSSSYVLLRPQGRYPDRSARVQVRWAARGSRPATARSQAGRYASWPAPDVCVEARLTGPWHLGRSSEQQALRLRIQIYEQPVEAARISRQLFEKLF